MTFDICLSFRNLKSVCQELSKMVWHLHIGPKMSSVEPPEVLSQIWSNSVEKFEPPERPLLEVRRFFQWCQEMHLGILRKFQAKKVQIFFWDFNFSETRPFVRCSKEMKELRTKVGLKMNYLLPQDGSLRNIKSEIVLHSENLFHLMAIFSQKGLRLWNLWLTVKNPLVNMKSKKWNFYHKSIYRDPNTNRLAL